MPIAPPLASHAGKAAALQGTFALHGMDNMVATAKLVASGIDSQTVGEFLELQDAAWQKLLALQEKWRQQWTSWYAYAAPAPPCKTLSKLLEREGNIAGQFVQTLSLQVTDAIGLQENIETSYRYWVTEKLRKKP